MSNVRIGESLKAGASEDGRYGNAKRKIVAEAAKGGRVTFKCSSAWWGAVSRYGL